MSNQTQSRLVADAATLPGALPLTRTTVIGLTISANPAALLRLRSGDIVRVQPGDVLNGAQILAIDEDGLVLSDNGTATRMALAA